MEGVVTAVVPQDRRGGRRVNVFVDGRFAFSLGHELAHLVRVGEALTAARIGELEREDLQARAFESALAFLSYRPRSEREIRDRLQKKGTPPPVVDGVVERLKRLKLVDDAEFARYWVEQRQTFRPRGGRLLKAELRRRGVSTETAAEVVAELEEDENPVEAACRAARRKAEALRRADERTFQLRIGQFLLRRGFDFETARAACHQLWSER